MYEIYNGIAISEGPARPHTRPVDDVVDHQFVRSLFAVLLVVRRHYAV